MKDKKSKINEIYQFNKQYNNMNKNTFSFGMAMVGLENLNIRSCPKHIQREPEVINIHMVDNYDNQKSDFLQEKSMKNLKVKPVPKLDLRKLQNSQYQNQNQYLTSNQKISVSNNFFNKTKYNSKNEEKNQNNHLREINDQFLHEYYKDFQGAQKSIHDKKYNYTEKSSKIHLYFQVQVKNKIAINY